LQLDDENKQKHKLIGTVCTMMLYKE